jgi:D-alanyl-D-alanine carboxypeptidase (penicillin-binding protein 5/6)
MRIISFLTLTVFAALFSFISYAEAETVSTPAKQAILIDFDTGMTLFSKDADKQMPTSSMSKVMTMYVVFDAIKNGQLKLTDTLQVSEKAWRKGGSKMFVNVNSQVKVEDLIRGVIIQSGNDATIVLAEGLSGTESAFAQSLTSTAKNIGMTNSNFMNASGWPDKDHYSTAKDLSTLAVALIKNFPEYYSYYGEREFTYNDITQKNRNPLLYRDIGADGIKTGHTNIGGYGLIGSGTRSGRRVILVVNGLSSEKARAQESAKLLDWGLRGFENMTLVNAQTEVEAAQVTLGKDKTVQMQTGDDIFITVPTLAKKDVKMTAYYEGPLEAPIAKGQEIGTLAVTISQVGDFEYPLYAAADVERVGIVMEVIQKAKRMIFSKKTKEEEGA